MEKKAPVRENSVAPEAIYGFRSQVTNVSKSVAQSTVNVTVSGTAGYAAVFSGTNAVTDSAHLFEDATGVGIGTVSPQTKLHVVGVALVCGFALDSGATAGHVLTAVDANGNAVWSAASGGIDGSGTADYIPKWSGAGTLTDSLIYQSGGSLSINAGGTTLSGVQLWVVGTGADYGIVGTSTSGYGVEGQSVSGNGVWGLSDSGIGVFAQSETGEALYAYSSDTTRSDPLAVIWVDGNTATGNALNLRQDGSGDIINATEDGTERFVVEHAGQTTISPSGSGTALRINATDTTGTNGDLHVTKSGSWGICYFDVASNTSTHGFQYLFRRGRGTIGSPSTVSNGDQIGGFLFRAHNGSDYQQRAGILAYVDGVPSGSSVPTGFRIYTGTTSMAEIGRFTSGGDFGLGETSVGARLDVKASNTTHALRVNQQSTGRIATFQDNGTDVVSVEDGGNLYARKGRRVNVTSIIGNTTLAATDDIVWVDTSSSAITITLPAPTAGKIITIRDSAGNAGTNNITVNDNGTELINGVGTQTISTNYGILRVCSNGTTWGLI